MRAGRVCQEKLDANGQRGFAVFVSRWEHPWSCRGLKHRMITDCVGAQQWDPSGTEAFFVQGVSTLIKLLTVIAGGVYIWKLCQTEQPHRRTSVLGLEQTTSHQE